MKRRSLLRVAACAALTGCANIGGHGAARVVVIGGGWGGATAARYLRMGSQHSIDVTLVEPNEVFVSCPMSNLVIASVSSMADITHSYTTLERAHGIRHVRDRAVRIDTERRMVTLASGSELPWDRLIVSPGIDFHWDTLPGMAAPGAREKVLHAWKGGPQTLALRRRLEGMPDGGTFAISIPLAPYRCLPAPYERACLAAHYFTRAKPRSKVLILDANEDVMSKAALFRKAWADRYRNIVEYRPNHKLIDVDAASNTLKFEFDDDIKADVLNVIPETGAGDIAVASGLATADRRWCEVDFLTFESKAARKVHVLGDSIQIAPVMPKSAHMAHQHGKTCAAAVIALLTGAEVNALPSYDNTCYSFVSDREAVHVSSVHRYDAAEHTMLPVAGAGGLSARASEQEGVDALAWARNIRADTFGS